MGWSRTESGLLVRDDGTSVARRGGLNLIAGDGISMTVTDDEPSDQVDVTITAVGAGADGSIVDYASAQHSSYAEFNSTSLANAPSLSEISVTVAVGDVIDLYYTANGAASGSGIYLVDGGFYLDGTRVTPVADHFGSFLAVSTTTSNGRRVVAAYRHVATSAGTKAIRFRARLNTAGTHAVYAQAISAMAFRPPA